MNASSRWARTPQIIAATIAPKIVPKFPEKAATAGNQFSPLLRGDPAPARPHFRFMLSPFCTSFALPAFLTSWVPYQNPP
jgi:hypothetical protein